MNDDSQGLLVHTQTHVRQFLHDFRKWSVVSKMLGKNISYQLQVEGSSLD